MKLCRACKKETLENFLSYKNMPESAQDFYKKNPLKKEVIKLDLYECLSCGVIQHLTNPVKYYKKVIRATAYSPEMKRFRIKQIRKWILENDLYKKNILEIGSGRGEFLDVFKEIGCKNIFGYEFSSENIKFSKKNNHNVCKYFLDKKPFFEKIKYDGFAIFSFLEHWPDPSLILRNLRMILNKDARGIVEVPNFDHIVNHGMYTEFIKDHILYFTIDSFYNFLSSNGFIVKKIKKIWHNYILSAEVVLRDKVNKKNFENNFLLINSQLKSFIKNSSFVVWGAGHQSLALLSMSDQASKLSYIIDSAPFKQNKFIPSLQTKILSPDILNTDNPKKIIVIAGSYSGEVYQTLRKKYKYNNQIAVLENNLLKIK